MRRIALVILIMFSVLQTFAQEMKVLSFVRAETDMTATNNRVLDVNDRVCALIKVETSESGISFTFGTSQIVKREEQNIEHPGEIWLYVPPGVTKVTIQKADYPVIRDYPLSEMLQSGRTYIMKITTDKIVSIVEPSVTRQFVSFEVSPPDAYLEFDGKPLQLKNGQASTANPVLFGVYSYRVEAENYHSENAKVNVNDPVNSIIVNVKLKPAYGSLEVSGESVRGGTVYLDKKYVGIAPVSLEIVPSGRHTLKVAKDMYNPYEEEIEITDRKNTLITPTMQPNFQNITFKADENAEIWINGKLRGTGYVKDDFEAGTLFVECKKENHRTTSANYSSVAGALPTTIKLMSPIPITGTLHVLSKPIGAIVFIDDENTGKKTPAQFDRLLIGNHKVTIMKDGFITENASAHIVENAIERLDVDLDRNSSVSFICNAGHVPLFVDGVNVGFADGTCSLTVGKHLVECMADNYYSYSDSIVVKPYYKQFVSINMEHKAVPVRFSCAEKNVSLFIDGTAVGKVDTICKLSVGEHAITCIGSIGYEIYEEQYEVMPEDTVLDYVIALRPRKSEISIDINGNYSGQLCLDGNTMFLSSTYAMPGMHTISAYNGKRTKSKNIDVKLYDGKVQHFRFRFRDSYKIYQFYGLSVGSGYQDGATKSFYNSIGFDFAVGVNKTYYGGFLSYKSVNSFSFGPQFMLGKMQVSKADNKFILGAGVNMRFDRKFYLSDAGTNTLRHEDFGVDGLLRLGVKIESGAYMFADFCIGKVSGSDYCENATQTTEWNKLRASASLNLGIHLNSGGFKVSDHYNYPMYSLNGWWSAIWFRFYGYGSYVNKLEPLNKNYGLGLDLFAFKIEVVEFSVLNCEYDAYTRTLDYMPRLRIIQPVSKLSAVYIEAGVKLYDGIYEFLSLIFHRMDKGVSHKVINSFVLQVGVNVGGWCEVFLRGSSGLGVGEMPQGTFALHAGLAFSFATGF